MQKVNLYILPPEPEAVKLPFIQVVLILLLLLGGFGIFSLGDVLQNKDVESGIEILREKIAGMEHKLTLLKANIPKTGEEQNLQKKAESLGKIKLLREQMFGELNKLQEEENAGFATYLYAISKYHISGIWLTRFEFLNRGENIILEGRTKNPGLVPELIEKLGKDPVFSGKSFESLSIERDKDDEDLLKFVLHSD